jgi:hypothetical protein
MSDTEKILETVETYLRAIRTGSEDDFRKALNDRMIFGTDHMVNLFHIKSYKTHLELFRDDYEFETRLNLDKKVFYTTNPRRFLFG